MGKYGVLGGNICCVVFVLMLIEGWDVNIVIYVLGIRVFGI